MPLGVEHKSHQEEVAGLQRSESTFDAVRR